MKIRNIVLGGVAGIMIFMLASCGSSVKDATFGGFDDPLADLVEESMENAKDAAKEADGNLSYTIKWSKGWDKDWLKDYCEDVRSQTEEKFKKEMKESNIELVTLNISGTAKNEDGDKYKFSTTYYLGRNTKKNVLFAAGGRSEYDGEIDKLDSDSARSSLQSLAYSAEPQNPFDNY